MPEVESLPKHIFDVAIIGAGVAGCAVARKFTLEGASVLVLEMGSDILSGVSKANSAILHTGFDAPGGSLELECIRTGYAEFMQIKDQFDLPVLQTGAIVVAWNEGEREKLNFAAEQARGNGVHDTQQLSTKEVLERSPHLAPSLLGGLLVPGESIIDPWSTPLAYITQAVLNGARIVFDTKVTGAIKDGNCWRLDTSKGSVRATFVINCAGLWGDAIEQMFVGRASFEIMPRKGQFIVLDKAASEFVWPIILPVPTERTKGVLIARTAFGNVLVGPTAEDQADRIHATVDHAVLSHLKQRAAELVPALADTKVTAVYAGLRPATNSKELCVTLHKDLGYLTLGGLRSTGLSAALGLASHAFKLYSLGAPQIEPLIAPQRPKTPNIAEHRTRDWELAGDNEIACHCELVTKREIGAALTGPLRARDFGGLKRRTRVCMGRCQGFYCSATIAELTRGHFACDLAMGPTK